MGEPVYAVGAPQGLELSLSEGIVSQLRGGPPPLIQTTVAISQGSSGGGLFNAEGELVGITTFYLKEGQSLNFALPVEWIGEVAGKKIRERPRGEAPVAPEPGARPQEGLGRPGNGVDESPGLAGSAGLLPPLDPGRAGQLLPGTTSALHTESWAVTGRPSKLTGRPCALSLILPRPGATSALLYTKLGQTPRRPSKPTERPCALSLIMPRPGTTLGLHTENWAATGRPSKLTRGAAR